MNLLGISIRIFNTVGFLYLPHPPAVDDLLVVRSLGTIFHLKVMDVSLLILVLLT